MPSVHSEAERFALARRLAAKGDCSTAIELLKTYIANNGGSRDVDEAIYQLGQCYLDTKQWAMAATEFERLLRDYPESDSSGSASFRLGQALFGQTRPPDFDQEYTLKALEQWQSYVRNYPGHWLNAEAARRIAVARHRLATKYVNTGKLYLKLRLIEPARLYFRRVETDYADTPDLGEALWGLAMCDARSGKRADAIQRLTDLETRFSGQAIAARAARERARLQRN